MLSTGFCTLPVIYYRHTTTDFTLQYTANPSPDGVGGLFMHLTSSVTRNHIPYWKWIHVGREGGGHSGLWYDTLSKWVFHYQIQHYGHRCRISTLIMVQINIWQNFYLFKKIHFSSSKIRVFQRKSFNFFKEILLNTKHKSLKHFWRYYDHFWYQIE